VTDRQAVQAVAAAAAAGGPQFEQLLATLAIASGVPSPVAWYGARTLACIAIDAISCAAQVEIESGMATIVDKR